MTLDAATLDAINVALREQEGPNWIAIVEDDELYMIDTAAHHGLRHHIVDVAGLLRTLGIAA